MVQGVAEAALLEAALVRGQVEEKIQSYILRSEVGVLRAIGEATQELEKEVQAAASGAVVTCMQQMQTLVGTVRGELRAPMEASHQEMKK